MEYHRSPPTDPTNPEDDLEQEPEEEEEEDEGEEFVSVTLALENGGIYKVSDDPEYQYQAVVTVSISGVEDSSNWTAQLSEVGGGAGVEFGDPESSGSGNESFSTQVNLEGTGNNSVEMQARWSNPFPTKIKAQVEDANGESHSAEVTLLPVELMEVSFGGNDDEYHGVENDELTETYSAPQWVDKDGDGVAKNEGEEKNKSVAYTRSTQPEIGCKFRIGGIPQDAQVKIRAKGSDGIEVRESSVSLAGDIATLDLIPCATESGTPTKWPDTVKFYSRSDTDGFSAFTLDWEIKFGSSEWVKIGSTKHQVYITLGKPIKEGYGLAKKNHESLFYIGCKNANGKSDQKDVVAGIWSDFTDRKVSRVDPETGIGTRDLSQEPPYPGGMIYWKNGMASASIGGAHSLLFHGHDVCWNWSDFFQSLLNFQGIQGHQRVAITCSDFTIDYESAVTAYREFSNFQGNLTCSAESSPSNAVPGDRHLYISQRIFFVKQLSLSEKTIVERPQAGFPGSSSKAQGNDNARAFFADHHIVSYDGEWYDPSYGTGPFEGEGVHAQWEESSLQLFGSAIVVQERQDTTMEPGYIGIPPHEWKDLKALLWVDFENPEDSVETIGTAAPNLN